MRSIVKTAVPLVAQLAMIWAVLCAHDGLGKESDARQTIDAVDVFHPETARRVVRQYGIEQLAFVKRATFQSSHYYTDFIDGCKFFGTDLCVLDLRTGRVRSLLPPNMKTGLINRIDVSADATRIVFDWKADHRSGFHLWEVGVDGRGLRQVTFPPGDEAEISRKYHLFKDRPYHWVKYPEKYPVDLGVYGHWSDDMHPCYLPDGGIAFVSTRCRYGILCDGPDIFTTTVLYRVDADGSNLRKLTNSSVSEANPVLMEDGRILYTRWEYVDKGDVSVKCLWAVRIDGTGSEEIYGNDIAMPPSLVHGRQVPGHPHLFVMTGAPHCPQTGVGTLIRVDRRRDIRSSSAMTVLTPETEIEGEGWFKHPWTTPAPDGDPRYGKCLGPHFADPYPLDPDTLIMVCQPDRNKMWKCPDGYGIYLYEGPGQYREIYRASGTSCWSPIPLKKRSAPAKTLASVDGQVAARQLAGQPLALCIVADVYGGLSGVERGEVKYIRINEQVPRPWEARRNWNFHSFHQQHSQVSATNLGLKVQWGVVPVEEDGSAAFYVPANRNVFLQVLDEHFQELQRERTYVNYRPGEVRSCVGCHETPSQAASVAMPASLMALRRSPSLPGPQPGEETGRRCLDYEADVQPILDRHCVRCHDGKAKDTDLDLRGTRTDLFCVSYENLIGLKCTPRSVDWYQVKRRDLLGRLIFENNPKVGNAEYLPPKSLGSTTAPLVKLLREGHYDVQLSEAEMIRLTTWIDSNAQYYGSYWGRKTLVHQKHPNFRPKVTFAQAIGRECPWPERDR